MAEENKCGRHSMWFMVAAFSTISLVALTSAIEDGADIGDTTKEYKWSVSAASISLSLSALAWFAHAAKDRFVGTTTEGGLAFLVLLMWVAGLPVMMKPEHDIAVSMVGEVENANLYFFSWAAFFTSLYLFFSYMRDVHEFGSSQEAGSSASVWLALMATSVVVLSSSSRIWKSGLDDVCDIDDNLDICPRTRFAVAIGTISAVICLLWVLMGHKMGNMVEALMGLVMLVGWCFGAAYITFGPGPGTSIGNLFFSTWGSFALSVMLASKGVHTLMAKYNGEEDTPAEDTKGDDKEAEGNAKMPEVKDDEEGDEAA